MVEYTAHYALSTEVDLPYEQAVELTREALNNEGFGVPTEIDVRAAPKNKLDVDFQLYVSSEPVTHPWLTRRSPPNETSASCCPAI